MISTKKPLIKPAITTPIIPSPKKIWVARLSTSPTDSIGHEQQGERPCIVIGNFEPGQLATIIPLTSTISALKFAYTIEIPKSKINNLEKNSIALIFQIRSLSFQRFKQKIGKINDDQLSQIQILLKDYLDLK